ncbi:MAG: transposase [Anaerocolumna sp.]
MFAEHREFEETEHFEEVQKVRPQIEQQNAHLKNRFGLDKTYGTGLLSMKAKSFLTAIIVNIVKIRKLATEM